MSETALLSAILALIECLAKTTISSSGKTLIAAYFKDAPGAQPAERARSVIWRYLKMEVPGLEEIRGRSKTGDLSKLDHLVLKMEHEAARLAHDPH